MPVYALPILPQILSHSVWHITLQAEFYVLIQWPLLAIHFKCSSVFMTSNKVIFQMYCFPGFHEVLIYWIHEVMSTLHQDQKLVLSLGSCCVGDSWLTFLAHVTSQLSSHLCITCPSGYTFEAAGFLTGAPALFMFIAYVTCTTTHESTGLWSRGIAVMWSIRAPKGEDDVDVSRQCESEWWWVSDVTSWPPVFLFLKWSTSACYIK